MFFFLEQFNESSLTILRKYDTVPVKHLKTYSAAFLAFSAGFIEGFLTSSLIHMHWQNTIIGYCIGKEKICKKSQKFVEKNTKWVKKKIAKFRNSSPYWHHIGLFYDQFEGLANGYNYAAAKGLVPSLPKNDLFWMNIFGDLEDLEGVFSSRLNITQYPGRILGSGSCSALIKLLPGNTELYAAHDTWNSYQSMLRIIKKYDLDFHKTSRHKESIPGKIMSFSSYPGVIYSGDDFSVISSGLTVIETTIGNSNPKLWKFVRSNGQILEGVRATVANRLAKNGESWTKIFSRRNSGTYNNQWMIVDYNKFEPNKPVKKNLLWVLEQLPGHIHAEDMTNVLVGQSYWPSYNSPYFKDIFNLSGSPALVQKFGNWFTYDKTPRALIFERDHSYVKDIKTMTRLMRYNNFRNDPLSSCTDCYPPYSAENAISARNDLNPKNGTYPFGALGHRSHGGTDMKLTTYKMSKNFEFIAISGPTYDDLQPFEWSKVDFGKDTPHFGHPDKWKFGPVHHKWSFY